MTTPHPTGLVESRLLGDGHGRFGGRVRETDRVKARHRALTRSYGEFLAATLRRGNAGSNTAADHITVLDAALTQLPDHHRHGTPILVRADTAGCTREFLAHIRSRREGGELRVLRRLGHHRQGTRRDQPIPAWLGGCHRRRR